VKLLVTITRGPEDVLGGYGGINGVARSVTIGINSGFLEIPRNIRR